MIHRQVEDVAACAAIGARPRHLGLLEALYRVDADGKPRHPDGSAIFQADARDEPDVLDQVHGQLGALLDELRPDLVLGPVGIGDHIDHLITHEALQRCDVEPEGVRWFEDLPYAIYGHHLDRDVHAARRPLQPEVEHVGGEPWQAKITGIGCYVSQHSVLWHGPTPWQSQLYDYALAIGNDEPAERLWVQSR